ncbi:MAG: T9SS type A sorting domain-containing protein [Bacteroidota bacterium]
MKKHKQPSFQLTIPEPCNEKWSEMTPVQGGRFCHQCDRHIVNFTDMSDHELAFYYQKNEGKICGVFRPDQLDRPITLPVAPISSMPWKVAAAVVAGLLVSGGVSGQQRFEQDTVVIKQPIKFGKSTQKVNPSNQIVLKGKVLTELKKEPLIYCRVAIKGTKLATTTNRRGDFVLRVPRKYANSTIEITYPDCETLCINNVDWEETLEVYMNCGWRAGSIFAWRESIIGVIAAKKNLPLPKSKDKEVSISREYVAVKKSEFSPIKDTSAVNSHHEVNPNPFGRELFINVETTKDGFYLVTLYDLGGQLLYAKTFQLTKGKQTLSIDDLPSNLAAGSYILQVTRDNEILLTEKVVKVK